ncbi:MAG TPA: DNA cytosine methyltransferase [Ktedonobacteraceae bacterium]|nr:DNA cytosine methyltransferase [Ktedonobacteraceae bacterium]
MQVIENIQSSPFRESKSHRILTSLELFAGAGGLALGTHAAGFKHIGLVEWNTFAIETLRDNSQKVLGLHPDFIFHCDARNVDYQMFAGKVDLLTGGPPCQPFSHGGQSRGFSDERDMFPVLLDAVAEIMPNAILIENVKGLLREKFRDYFSYILKRLQFPLSRKEDGESWQNHYKRLCVRNERDFADEEQYVVAYQLVNAANYGIPQMRERVIITAFRRDLGIDTFHIQATHSKETLFINQWITGAYWDVYNISPCAYYLNSVDKEMVEKLRNQLFFADHTLPWLTTRDVIHDLPTPVARGFQEEISNHIQHPGARVYPGHTGSLLDYPAKALKAGAHGTPGGENVLCVPSEGIVRYFTAREAARLQTFPDIWHFHGSWGACMKQLGNAVPAELIRIFALEIGQRLAKVVA